MINSQQPQTIQSQPKIQNPPIQHQQIQQSSQNTIHKFISPRTSNFSIYSQTQVLNAKNIADKLFQLDRNLEIIGKVIQKENTSCASINQGDMVRFLQPFCSQGQIRHADLVHLRIQAKQHQSQKIQKDSYEIQKQHQQQIYNQQHKQHQQNQQHQQIQQSQQIQQNQQNIQNQQIQQSQKNKQILQQQASKQQSPQKYQHQQTQSHSHQQLKQRQQQQQHLQQQQQDKWINVSLIINKDKTRKISQFGISLQTVVQEQPQCQTKRAGQQTSRVKQTTNRSEQQTKRSEQLQQDAIRQLQQSKKPIAPEQGQLIQQIQRQTKQLQKAAQQMKRSSLLLQQAQSLSQKPHVHFAQPATSETSSISLYEQILSKNFEIIDSLLRKINQIFANQQQSQSILSQIRQKLVKIEIDNQNIHYQFRTSHFAMDRKINLVMVQYGNVLEELDRIKREIRDQKGNFTRNFNQEGIVINQQGMSNHYGKAIQLNSNIPPRISINSQQDDLNRTKIQKNNFFFGQTQRKLKQQHEQQQDRKRQLTPKKVCSILKKSSNCLQIQSTSQILPQPNAQQKQLKKQLSNNINENNNQYVKTINSIQHEDRFGGVNNKDIEGLLGKMVEKIQMKMETRILGIREEIMTIKGEIIAINQTQLKAVNLRIAAINNQLQSSLQQSQSRINSQLLTKSNQCQTSHRLSILSQQLNFRIHNIIDEYSLKFAIRSETKRAIVFIQNKLNKIIQAQQLKDNTIIISGDLTQNQEQCLSCNGNGKGGMLNKVQLANTGRENVGNFFNANSRVLNNSSLAKQSRVFKQDRSSYVKKSYQQFPIPSITSQSGLKFHHLQQQPLKQSQQQTYQKVGSFHKTFQIRSKNSSTYQQNKQQRFQSSRQKKLWKDKVTSILQKKDRVGTTGNTRYRKE